MKKNRQEKLLEIIARYDVDTQDELIERLRDCGFETTQATISTSSRSLLRTRLSCTILTRERGITAALGMRCLT